VFPDDVLSPRCRAALLAALAFALLATPLWAPTDEFAGDTYTYERSEVVVDEDGISYVDEPRIRGIGPISEDLGCSTQFSSRTCAFERLLVENETVPTEIYTSNADNTALPSTDRYRYVQIDGNVYETEYVANESATRSDGMYRLDLALDRAVASDALERISIDASSDHSDVPDVVVEAAREGSATTPEEVRAPRTPIQLDDGRHYRVYQTGSSSPDVDPRVIDVLFDVSGVTVGLIVLDVLRRRFEVSYVGDRR